MGGHLSAKLCVTFAKRPLTSSWFVAALDLTALSIQTVAILFELANALVTVLHLDAFDAILVGLADSVELVNWLAMTRVRHWPIAKDETIASISPVLALIKVGHVKLGDLVEIVIST